MSDEQRDGAREEMERFSEQDEVPSDLEQWPDGKAKYMTFGGPEDENDEAYGEGDTAKLGPQVTHHADGSVTADGEKVEDPEAYKGDPIELAVDVRNPDHQE